MAASHLDAHKSALQLRVAKVKGWKCSLAQDLLSTTMCPQGIIFLQKLNVFQLFAPPRTCEFVTSKVNFLKMNPRKASEDREKWLEGGGREAGGGESDDDLGDKVPQFYIYKLPINRLSSPMLVVVVVVVV